MIVPLLLVSIREPLRRSIPEFRASIPATAARFWSGRKLLIPLYMGMGLLSIGDFSLFSWVPSLLSRKFHLSPDTMGLWFGGIVAVTSVVGVGLGGFLADWAARHGGNSARLKMSAFASVLAVTGAVLVSGPGAAFALGGAGVWVFGSMLAFMSAYVAIQTMIPAEHRALGVGLVAFCNMMLGLGLGPTLVALVTEEIFADPLYVGFAITTIAMPAGLFACALFAYVASVTTPFTEPALTEYT
jgi:MFS family permease